MTFGPRFVERASIRPRHCAMLPHLGPNHPRGYIDLGMDLPASGFDQRVYLSTVAGEQVAHLVGFVPARDVRTAEAERDAALARVAELEQVIADQEQQLLAVDLLESAGFTRRKKPGRPSKQREEVEA